SQGKPAQAQVLQDAAEEVRRLLHQFAAGFLKEPATGVEQALQEILETELGNSLPPAEEVLTYSALAPVPMSLPAAVHARDASASDLGIDKGIDVEDTIDPELFSIFEEEAVELLPEIGGALRRWSEHASDMHARSEVLRALHTLKGSSRLAGAMRLGEMAHRLESAIEELGSEGLHESEIEPLLAAFDVLQSDFDALRAKGQEVQGEALPQDTPSAPQPAVAAPVASIPSVPTVGTEAVIASAVAVQPEVATSTHVARLPPQPPTIAPLRPASAGQSVRVRSQLLDQLVNQAGEVMMARSRMEIRLGQLRSSLGDLSGNLERLRTQLRDIEVQAESQMQSRLAQAKDSAAGFDPLELDRFTRVQELTRMMAESVNDVATVHRNLQRAMEGTEDELVAQGRQARELQRDLLRTRMVEFESIAERLYAVVRQAAKETGKQVRLDIAGGVIEMDRGVLDRMAPAFEHLLRNAVVHGVEAESLRIAAGKPATGTIAIHLRQEGNDVSVDFHDDGAGLNLPRIRAKAIELGLVDADARLDDAQAANLIFMPGFSTASEVTGLAGRGIGTDVVRTDVQALGGRIETSSQIGKGTNFRLVLPLTTAVTQVVMLRAGNLTLGVPASLIEVVRRIPAAELAQAYQKGLFAYNGDDLPFFWCGALLQSSVRSGEPQGKSSSVLVVRSAAQRVAVHVDEVLGNQEVVVKNLGPQLARLPGLAGMSVLASGAVVLIYNPVALATVYGTQVHAYEAEEAAKLQSASEGNQGTISPPIPVAGLVPLVLVVDDSITVRRVTQRLLQREGYRVALA
ncbi:MAG TPA: chemotaxis protein CheW, partial [Burkholderiaceae bacterium]